MKKSPSVFLISTTLLWYSMGCFPSYAAEIETHNVRFYEVYWGGIHVGDIIGDLKTYEDHYDFRLALRARNILKTFTKYRNNTTTIAHYDASHHIKPGSFAMEVALRKKVKHIKIDYNNTGTIQTEFNDHPQNPLKVSPISDDMKNKSVDPLTAALIAREYVRKYQKEAGGKDFSIFVYEGKHFFEVHCAIQGRQSIALQGKDMPVILVQCLRTAIAGFSEEDLKDMIEEEPIINVYLNDDAMLLPVQAEGKAPIGKATAILKKECVTFEGCAAIK